MIMHDNVMIVDDNEIDLIVGKRVIEKFSFARNVILVESAIKAMEYLEAHADEEDKLPDLIFLDINMPEMNGFEFLDAYAGLAEKMKRKCIIMMLTTSAHPDDRERAAKSPYVYDYMNKPLSGDKLKQVDERDCENNGAANK